MTINSMTGYARMGGEMDGMSWTWEAKSVNGKGLEFRTRLPPGFDSIDLSVREAAQKHFKRGNISLTLTLVRKAETAPVAVNEVLLDQLIALSRRWREKAPDLDPPRLDGLLALRGVLEAGDTIETGQDEAQSEFLLGRCEATLTQLAAMRAAEGKRLAAVLQGLLDEIAGLVAEARDTAQLVPEQIKTRLRQMVATLLDSSAGLSEERLAQEAALLVGKADVREELDRLEAHLSAAGKMLATPEPIGRKLDFLCQEFNREANTLCSKANDIALTRIGLGLKAAIEQFREQVQNIE